MGAWGEETFENESAIDWLEQLADTQAKKAVGWRGDPDILRVTVELVIWASRHAPVEDAVRRLLPAMQKLHDSDWPDSWRDPAKIRRALKSQMSRLRKLQSSGSSSSPSGKKNPGTKRGRLKATTKEILRRAMKGT